MKVDLPALGLPKIAIFLPSGACSFSFGNDVTSLNLNYEANVNDDEYLNQYGSIKIVAKF